MPKPPLDSLGAAPQNTIGSGVKRPRGKPFAPGQSGNPSTQFQPGQSGNPGGRPKKLAEVEALAAEHSQEVIGRFLEILRDPEAPHTAQLRAGELLLERAWGKPRQPIEHTGDQSRIMTPDEIRAIADEIEENMKFADARESILT